MKGWFNTPAPSPRALQDPLPSNIFTPHWCKVALAGIHYQKTELSFTVHTWQQSGGGEAHLKRHQSTNTLHNVKSEDRCLKLSAESYFLSLWSKRTL
jgi:hypothetical protein